MCKYLKYLFMASSNCKILTTHWLIHLQAFIYTAMLIELIPNNYLCLTLFKLGSSSRLKVLLIQTIHSV